MRRGEVPSTVLASSNHMSYASSDVCSSGKASSSTLTVPIFVLPVQVQVK
jgi:hypothetical protein